jgi:hypothetical protein
MLQAFLFLVIAMNPFQVSVSDLFSYLTGATAFLFVLVTVLIFVYIYDNMRRGRKAATPTEA